MNSLTRKSGSVASFEANRIVRLMLCSLTDEANGTDHMTCISISSAFFTCWFWRTSAFLLWHWGMLLVVGAVLYSTMAFPLLQFKFDDAKELRENS
jgi:hypothetical protein